MKKIILAMISIFAVLFHCSVYADDNRLFTESETIDDISIGKITLDENDDSDTIVEVTLTSCTGESSVIYTGTLEGYGDEMITNIDFSETNAVIIFDWDSGDCITIKTIEDNDSADGINNILMSTEVIQPTLNINATYYINDNLITGNLESESIQTDDEVHASYSITNMQNHSQEVQLILCLYDNNHRLINSSIASAVVMANETKTVEKNVVIENDIDNCYVKVLLWDSFAGLYPLYNPVQIGDANISQSIATANVECIANKKYNLVTTIENMPINDDGIYTVKYDPEALQVIDLCSLTYKKELEIGNIFGTEITILDLDTVNGEITFRNPNSTSDNVNKVLNSISFKGLLSDTNTAIMIE